MKEATLNVDLDALVYNYRHLKCYYQKNVIAVLKDNAYGVGLIPLMKALQYEEGLIIAIAHLDEAILLRENGYNGAILYLNIFEKEDLPIILKYQISVVVESLFQLNLLKNTMIPFHLKFNCGMNRLGLDEEDEKKVYHLLSSQPKSFHLVGLMTHFATSDKNHECYYRFEKIIKKYDYSNLIVHCFASSSLDADFKDLTNTIRVGIKLFGIGERCSFLHHVLTLSAPVIKIKAIMENESVGYDYLFKTPTKGYLYLLPLGYGQGWGRLLNSFAFTNYVYLKQAGNISMDYSCYFYKDALNIENEVELFGKNIHVEELARINHLDPHEILVKLKVKKNYLKKTI